MGGYKKKTGRGVKDAMVLLAAIKEVVLEGKAMYAAAGSFGFPFSSFRRYVRKFKALVPNASEATDAQLIEVILKISSYGAPTVCIFSFLFLLFVLLSSSLWF